MPKPPRWALRVQRLPSAVWKFIRLKKEKCPATTSSTRGYQLPPPDPKIRGLQKMVAETMQEHRQAVQDDIAQMRSEFLQEVYKYTVTTEAGFQDVTASISRLSGRVVTLEKALERFTAKNDVLVSDMEALRVSHEATVAQKVRRRPPALGPLSTPTLPVAEKHYQEATAAQPGTSSRKYLDSQGRVVDGQALTKSGPPEPA